jgi:2'-5' RNA ligase
VKLAGLSLWLVPEPKARRRLGATIARLARRLGTPRFAPHVTLIGGLRRPPHQLSAVAARIARATVPFELCAASFGERREFYRCVFVAFERSRALAEMRARARRTLGPSRRRFFAHLSVVYGDLDARTRRGLVAKLARASRAPIRFARLQLMRTEGEPRDWRLVASFALSRRA